MHARQAQIILSLPARGASPTTKQILPPLTTTVFDPTLNGESQISHGEKYNPTVQKATHCKGLGKPLNTENTIIALNKYDEIMSAPIVNSHCIMPKAVSFSNPPHMQIHCIDSREKSCRRSSGLKNITTRNTSTAAVPSIFLA